MSPIDGRDEPTLILDKLHRRSRNLHLESPVDPPQIELLARGQAKLLEPMHELGWLLRTFEQGAQSVRQLVGLRLREPARVQQDQARVSVA